MKTLKIIAVSVLVLPIMAFGQTTNTTSILPDPGLTPDSPFYFLNRVGEALQEFFTFNPEARARLELQFAEERISEIKAMLIEKGATLPAIETAKTYLTENLAKASEAVTKVKTSGGDVVGLAKEISDKINSRKLALSSVFTENEKNLLEQERSIREKIKEADLAGDVEKAKDLVKNLDTVNSEKEAVKKHRDESSKNFDDEEDNVDKNLELKDQAQSVIDDVKKARAELLVEIPEITVADLELADKAIVSAEDLFVKENFQASKELAHQAEKALERAKESFEKKSENDEEGDELIKKYTELESESFKKLEEIDRESAKKMEELNKETSQKLEETSVESAKNADEISSEAAKKLEEINRENEKKQWELNNEIEKFGEELKNSTSTED
ncbi:MAG: DUF5667 domain-containing protein [Minisyncoccota bacterium]